jgi:LPXTG-motif cell wall-anchored protein
MDSTTISIIIVGAFVIGLAYFYRKKQKDNDNDPAPSGTPVKPPRKPLPGDENRLP